VDRIVEPELMNEDGQARAYAEADFSEPHDHFVELFAQRFPSLDSGVVLDVGCGPGDITVRIAKAFPHCQVHGVDGSAAMLSYKDMILGKSPEVSDRVHFIHGFLPGALLPLPQYDAIISNSILHHLHEPQVLWSAVKQYARPGAPIFIMDLLRPDSVTDAERMREQYASDEPEVLQIDFYNSLLAAFRPNEIEMQLSNAGLAHLKVEVTSDRHVVICGYGAHQLVD
jgi:SAM-dependent methyltransferase